MARLSSTVALFLVLAGVMGNFVVAGWNEFARRASLAARANLARGAECRPPLCILCPRGGGIHWPAKFHGRQTARR